jgi:hypothetical protein
MKYQAKNVIIGYLNDFVAGFSLKTQKVYKTNNPSDARRFTAIEAHNFIADHANKNEAFKTEYVRIHLLKPGQPFNPIENEKQDI